MKNKIRKLSDVDTYGLYRWVEYQKQVDNLDTSECVEYAYSQKLEVAMRAAVGRGKLVARVFTRKPYIYLARLEVEG